MKRFALLIPVLFSACVQSTKAPPATSCFGKAGSNRFIVYLHGMDIPAQSSQEIENRQKILRIADGIGARVAMPRANSFCPGNSAQICWGWKFDEKELLNIKLQIESAAAMCGAPPSYELVGFSNGGYAINKLFEKCMLSPHQRFVSIGAANLPFKSDSSKLNHCGRLNLIVGKKDLYNNSGREAYKENLIAREGKVVLTEHPGNHEIPESVLMNTLISE